jgi:hypothetical protein
MDKLLVAACAFIFGSALALADGDTEPQGRATTPSGTPLIGDFDSMSTEQDRAARAAAKAKWDKMTPEEQAAVKKAAAKKRRQDLTALEAVASEQGPVYEPKKEGLIGGFGPACPPRIPECQQTSPPPQNR